MATRILQADVRDFVKNTLLNVRLGLEDAVAQGLIVELPKSMEFELDVISSPQSNITVTTGSTSGVEPISVETTVEGASVDNETDTRFATQATGEVGGDTVTQTKNYTNFPL